MSKDGDRSILARRKFREMELPVMSEMGDDGKPTGRFVDSEEKAFWELIPEKRPNSNRYKIDVRQFIQTGLAKFQLN